jgi:hypothetical protein
MYKKEKIKTLQVLAVLITISALVASITGIIFPDSYKPIVLDKEMPFVFAQDIISFIASVLLFITFLGKKRNVKLDMIRIGTIGYLFYVYGQYAMGTVYNYYYFLYLFIFGLSVFYFINAFVGIEYEKLEFTMPKSLRIVIAGYCAIMPVFFAPQWIIELWHYIQNYSRPGAGGLTFNYYVYILDLCFVLPVCAVASVFLSQKKIMGFLLGGILSIFGFALMLWVALGFFCQPLFHRNMNVGWAATYSVITLVFLVLSIFYFIYTNIIKTGAQPGTKTV